MCVALSESGIVLSNSRVALRFEPKHGRLVSLKNLRTGTELIRDPRLAENFRLRVPVGELVSNYVFGRDQSLSRWEKVRVGGGWQLSLTWDRVRAISGPLDVPVKLNVFLADEGDEFIFRLSLGNGTPFVLEEAWCPIIGGFQSVGAPDETELVSPHQSDGRRFGDPFNQFPEALEGYRSPYPTIVWTYPGLIGMQWLDFHNGREGLYLGCHDSTCTHTDFILERHPGIGHMMCTFPTVPSHLPQGLALAIVKHPYLEPGETWESPLAVIALHEGDWHAGADRYRSWVLSWIEIRERTGWMADFEGWQHLIINEPNGLVHYCFEELPAILAAVQPFGIDTLNVIGLQSIGAGWVHPDNTLDPKLGTEDDFRKALAEIHRRGGRVIAFMKPHRADPATEWYQHELHRYAVKSRDGIDLRLQFPVDPIDGIRQGPPWAAQMCTGSSEWRDIIAAQVMKLVALGVDGVQFDEVGDCDLFCFDASHGHRPADGMPQGMLELLRRVHTEAKAMNPDFVVTGEYLFDAQYQFAEVAYARANPGASPEVWKYTFPEFPRTILVEAYDYDHVSQALLFGSPFNVEVFRMRGLLSDEPTVAEYVAQIIQLRRKLGDYLKHGRFRDTLGAQVQGEARYGVHESDAGRAVVVWNPTSQEQAVTVTLDETFPLGEVWFYRPGSDGQAADHPVQVRVEPHRAVVIVAPIQRRR